MPRCRVHYAVVRVSPVGFIGRRSGSHGAWLNVPPGTDATKALIGHLGAPKTFTARELAGKAVVLLEPKLGMVISRAESHSCL